MSRVDEALRRAALTKERRGPGRVKHASRSIRPDSTVTSPRPANATAAPAEKPARSAELRIPRFNSVAVGSASREDGALISRFPKRRPADWS